jgi:hypothetical protein
MHNITVFNTEHGEAGKCNINELYRIIESINPEIIFEEIPPCVFDEYYKNMTRNNLETNAIKIYLKNHNILPRFNWQVQHRHNRSVYASGLKPLGVPFR